MEVQDVEFAVVALATNAFEHLHMQCIGIAHRTIEAQRLRPASIEPGGRVGIAARKKRDVVPLRDELFGQPVHDTFSTAVELRRDSFSQWSHLRDAHLHISHVGSEGLAT